MRILFVIICCFVVSCAKETPTMPVKKAGDSDQSYQALRKKVIAQVVSQNDARFDNFESKLKDSENAILAWSKSDSVKDLDLSKAAFKAMILSWQEVEAALHLPFDTEEMWTVTRDDIYSWPLTNHCRVDQELSKKSYEKADAFSTLLVNAKGLDALEYLLWHGEENNCPPQSKINKEGKWELILDLSKRRAAFALVILNLVKSQTKTLRQDSIALGDTLKKSNTAEALNTLSNTLFYLDTNVKDMKIAHPLGIQDCATAACFDNSELILVKASLSSIHHNLIAFEQLFFGEPGFDDLLAASDSKEMADQINVNLKKAKSLSAGKDTLEEIAASGKGRELFDSIKSITDRLKTDFVGVLDLELPRRAEGDND